MRHSHSHKICLAFLHCVLTLFSTVRFQMSPQCACLGSSIVTLVAFVWLFSTVHFQMCIQIVFPRRGKVTFSSISSLSRISSSAVFAASAAEAHQQYKQHKPY